MPLQNPRDGGTPVATHCLDHSARLSTKISCRPSQGQAALGCLPSPFQGATRQEQTLKRKPQPPIPPHTHVCTCVHTHRRVCAKGRSFLHLQSPSSPLPAWGPVLLIMLLQSQDLELPQTGPSIGKEKNVLEVSHGSLWMAVSCWLECLGAAQEEGARACEERQLGRAQGKQEER